MEHIFHLKLDDFNYSVKYIVSLMPLLKQYGFTAVLFDLRTNFPYNSIPELKKNSTFSKNDFTGIFNAAENANLAIMVLGISMSHTRRLGNYPGLRKYLEENNPDNLDLTSAQAADFIARAAGDIIALCPKLSLLHIGGDEMLSLGKSAKANAQIIKNGKGRLVASFVNMVSSRLKNIRLGMWSDMLIRHPEAINTLSKKIIIFYWDYWGQGERSPFISIGGGLSDTFVLDRSKISEDQKQLFSWHIARPAQEIPAGHKSLFKKYWNIKNNMADSFPYLKWFRDKGFIVISAYLAYTEKGSILPNTGEKISHIKTFFEKSIKHRAAGVCFCLWTPQWPLLDAMKPAMILSNIILSNPGADHSRLFKKAADSSGLSPVIFKLLLTGVLRFEFSDSLDLFWKESSLNAKLKQITAAGEILHEKKKLVHVINSMQKILKHPSFYRTDMGIRLPVKEMLLKAQLEILLLNENPDLIKIKKIFKLCCCQAAEFKKYLRMIMPEKSADYLYTKRWKIFLKELSGIIVIAGKK